MYRGQKIEIFSVFKSYSRFQLCKHTRHVGGVSFLISTHLRLLSLGHVTLLSLDVTCIKRGASWFTQNALFHFWSCEHRSNNKSHIKLTVNDCADGIYSFSCLACSRVSKLFLVSRGSSEGALKTGVNPAQVLSRTWVGCVRSGNVHM